MSPVDIRAFRDDLVEISVECYRLWPDGHWDKVPITVSVPRPLKDHEEFVEGQAVQKAWLDLFGEDEKPDQIGLYFPSYHKVYRD